MDAFLADKSPNAWEKVIDHLLASPHYGERWGRHWLDLARFAESHGYEQDYDRPYAYNYRDFVIKALNSDLPYNTFVQWQLAGDEISPDNPLALMATGFLAAGTHATQITKNQVEKERYDELDDMLSTTGVTFLGLTLGCARCHNHKYDPIPSRDYYRLLSTFTTTVRSDYDINMDPEGYRKAKETFDREHTPLVEAQKRFETDELPGRLQEWMRTRKPNDHAIWQVAKITNANSIGGATMTEQEDGSFLASGKNPDNDTYILSVSTSLRNITAFRLEALSDPSLVKGGPGRASNGNFALTDIKVTVRPFDASAKPMEVKLATPRATFEQNGLPIKATIDNDPRSGWAVDPQFGKDQAAIFPLETPVAGSNTGIELTFTLKFDNNTGHSIGRPRISLTTAAAQPAFDALERPESVEKDLIAIDSGKRAFTGTEISLPLWYRKQDPEWKRLNKAVQEHLAQEPKPTLQKALISSEGVTAVRTHTQGGDFLDSTCFLKRGDPNQKDGVATQGFLQVLMRSPEGEKRWQVAPPKGWRTSYQRRSLANWITDVDAGGGTLLARVIVNRLWQHHMGRGIVATPSDFGTQGERPTHPELLDWLATELLRNGWRLKPIHKLILTSAAYKQSAAFDPQKAKGDPANKLCWRHPRQRLEAEVLRDSLLSVSGQLDTTMYGPGTLDETMKRRSLYFFVKRSRLIPTMMLFDAPNALQSIGTRATTTVAPQALMLMNSRIMRECAAHLAHRAAPTPETPRPEAVRAAYRLVLGRAPTTRESADVLAFLQSQTASYTGSGSTPAELAFTDLCQALLSLNEFVYVE